GPEHHLVPEVGEPAPVGVQQPQPRERRRTQNVGTPRRGVPRRPCRLRPLDVEGRNEHRRVQVDEYRRRIDVRQWTRSTTTQARGRCEWRAATARACGRGLSYAPGVDRGRRAWLAPVDAHQIGPDVQSWGESRFDAAQKWCPRTVATLPVQRNEVATWCRESGQDHGQAEELAPDATDDRDAGVRRMNGIHHEADERAVRILDDEARALGARCALWAGCPFGARRPFRARRAV